MDTLASVTPVVVGVLGTHALLKLGFFLVPYPKRRAALDKSYEGAPSATRISDLVLLGMTVALSVLLFWRGVDAVSFLGGIRIGATLIQLYFHQFHAPLPLDRTAPPVVSPITRSRSRTRFELARCVRDLPSATEAFTKFEGIRRDRVEAAVKQSRRTGNQKAPTGAIGRRIRDLVLPVFLRMGAKAAQGMYAYPFNWDERLA